MGDDLSGTLTQSYSYTLDATGKGGTTYTYDANGNTLTETLDGQVTQSQYDGKDQLVHVTKTGVVTQYRYNVNGIRNEKVENGLLTRYRVDENRDYAQVLVESNAVQDIVYSYGDDLISQTQSGVRHYYAYDGLGSTRALTDNSGNISDRYNYDAFGVELNSAGTTPNAYRFTGEQYDSSLKEYYLRARYYDPKAGRFTQMDTYQGNSSDPVTLHKYLYANVDPVNHTDPSGHFGLADLGAADSIRSTLFSIQTDIGFQIGNSINDPESVSSSNLGWSIILSTSGAPLKGLFRGLAENKFGSAFVRYCTGNKTKPSVKEIDAANFLAEKFGHRIFIRGSGVEGADFLMDGVKWELKTLKSPTNNAVATRIKESMKKGNQGSRFIIDGRIGLTKEEAIEGINRAIRNGYEPSHVKVILKDGEVFNWPL